MGLGEAFNIQIMEHCILIRPLKHPYLQMSLKYSNAFKGYHLKTDKIQELVSMIHSLSSSSN